MNLKVSTVCGLPSSVISKSVRLEIGDRTVPFLSDDDHVDADEVDAGAEDRLLAVGAVGRRGGGWLLRRGRRR